MIPAIVQRLGCKGSFICFDRQLRRTLPAAVVGEQCERVASELKLDGFVETRVEKQKTTNCF
jgi:hypothetical protein